MTPEQRLALHELLDRERVLALGVEVDGQPHVGMLPYARTADGGALIVHASRLAKHSRGLAVGASFSALVHQADSGMGDPLQLLRVMLAGRVVPLTRNAPDWTAARDTYLARLPSAAVTFQLGDFTLHLLRVERGRFVAGFADAVAFEAADLATGR